MGKGIKTREVVKDIKVHDSAVNVGDRIKNIGVKTKDTVNENIEQTDYGSPEQYAADKVSEAMKSGTESAAVGTEKAVRKGASKAKEKVKEKVAEKKAKKNAEGQKEQEVPSDENATAESKPERTKSEPKKNADKTAQTKADKGDAKVVKEKQDKTVIKEKTQASPKSKTQLETTVEEIKKPRQRKQTAPKTKGKATIKKVGAEKQTVKTINNEAHKIKQSKRNLDATAKGIKKADKTVKTAKNTVKTTASTKRTAEVTKRTKQTAQATVRVTIKTVKVAAKVFVEAGKAVVAGAKSIGAIIAGGGLPAIVVIIIICLIGAIGGTCFGIFLANDATTGTQKTMSQAISELTSEHYANLTAMKASYAYDLLEVQGNTSINWKDVLAVYAVKTTSGDNPLEVVTLDDEKMDLLRGIMEDMNTMTGVVTPKVVAETTVTTDENGNSIKTTTYDTKKVLTVSIIQLSIDGVVVTATWHNSYGYYVKIKLDDTYSTLYAHCSALHVSVGQTVKQGQVIADCGSTGYSTGPHLHYEVIQNGVRVDALNFYRN